MPSKPVDLHHACVSACLSARVVALISTQLSHGEPDRQQLAQPLNLSERSLQRRLAEEGNSQPHSA